MHMLTTKHMIKPRKMENNKTITKHEYRITKNQNTTVASLDTKDSTTHQERTEQAHCEHDIVQHLVVQSVMEDDDDEHSQNALQPWQLSCIHCCHQLVAILLVSEYSHNMHILTS